jgi:hypothetical protein
MRWNTYGLKKMRLPPWRRRAKCNEDPSRRSEEVVKWSSGRRFPLERGRALIAASPPRRIGRLRLPHGEMGRAEPPAIARLEVGGMLPYFISLLEVEGP